MFIRIMCFDLYRKLVVARDPGSPVAALLLSSRRAGAGHPLTESSGLASDEPSAACEFESCLHVCASVWRLADVSSSQWKVTARAPLIFAHGQVSCIRTTIEHAHAQLTVVIVAPPKYAGQAASDADDVKVPNTDFTTVLRRMPSTQHGPRVSESNRAVRQETARPAMETSCRVLQKLVYGIARVGR